MIKLLTREVIKEVEKPVTKAMVMEFLKKNPLTEDEVLRLYADTITDCNDATISPKFHEQLMTTLSNVEGFADYLRTTISKDMQRYFNAQTPHEQLMLKGAANRTLYLRTSIQKIKEAKAPSKAEDLGIKRYVK